MMAATLMAARRRIARQIQLHWHWRRCSARQTRMVRTRWLAAGGVTAFGILILTVAIFRPPRAHETVSLSRHAIRLPFWNNTLLPDEAWLSGTAGGEVGTHFGMPPPPLCDHHNLPARAVVTLASGDEAGRQAVALVQSLRDVGTRIPTILVLLSRGGVGSRMCQDMQRQHRIGRVLPCDGPHTRPEEIVSQPYLDALHALGAVMQIVGPIPRTPYTDIPGGTQSFWGMAFNKLHVFGLTEFRKVRGALHRPCAGGFSNSCLSPCPHPASRRCCGWIAVSATRSWASVESHAQLSAPPRTQTR